MSSSLTPPPLSNGSPNYFPNLWKSFVQVVLEITVQAYQNMRLARVARREWEEDTFTINLEDYIRPIAYKHPLSLTVVSRSRVYVAGMKTGEISTKEAKEIDIRLWGRWENYDRIHFTWESKLIADKRVDTEHEYLINEYIKNGMFRFIDKRYSSEVDDAGMLGYVLNGDIFNIVCDVNQSMINPRRERQLAASDQLQVSPSISNFTDVYQSQHSRGPNTKPIQLYHLFLSFEFDQDTNIEG